MPYELTRREVICGGLILAMSGGGSRDLHCTAYAGSSLAFAGVNLAGAEFGKVPGTYATDYTYPAPASIDYFSQLGFNLIRVPFRWERLQPTLASPFAATDGWSADHLIGSNLVPAAAFTDYCRRLAAVFKGTRQSGVKAFLGEFAAGDDEVSLAALNDICSTLHANSDVWLGWAAWAGGSWWPADYIFNLEPSKNGQIRPQTKILAGYARRDEAAPGKM
jgi:aryl-phospho-beta-D-glucosidase BglC (GH1 family)